jgi:hypothetical protein
MCRRLLVRAVVVIALAGGTSLAVANSFGPPVSRTGATPIGGVVGEQLCTLCHNLWPPNDGTGELQLLDVPATYKTGDTITFRIALSRPTPPETKAPKWGFEITAVGRNFGQGAGTWLPTTSPPEESLQVRWPAAGTFRTRRYLMHSATSTRTGQLHGAEWTVKFVAPSTDSGSIYFFAAGNAANGDGASIGTDDHIFTTVDSIVPADTTLVGVPPHGPQLYATLLHAPYPNPMTLCSDMSFEVATAGHVVLAIHDVQGRRVRTLYKGWHRAGPGFNFWDGKLDTGHQAANGVYFVRLMTPDLRKPLVRKITLAR